MSIWKPEACKTNTLKAFSLIETVVALLVIAVVGLVMLSVSARSIRQQVLTDMRFQMEGYAADALAKVQQVYAGRWENLPQEANGMYVLGTDASGTVTLPKSSANALCQWEAGEVDNYLSTSSCELLAESNNMFVRAIKVEKGSTDMLDWKKITAVITCQEGRCDSRHVKPFQLSIKFYSYNSSIITPTPTPTPTPTASPTPPPTPTPPSVATLTMWQSNQVYESRNELQSFINGDYSVIPDPAVVTMYTMSGFKSSGAPSCQWQTSNTYLDPATCDKLADGYLLRGVRVVRSSDPVTGKYSKHVGVYITCNPEKCTQPSTPAFVQFSVIQ